jgi:hypothetical protein
MGDYNNPILKPEAAQIVKKAGEVASTGAAYPTPSNRCWPGGVPFVFWNIGMQMLQKPDKVTIIYSNDHEVRHVRLNQPHRTPVTPLWYGDSVGRYEGDTLVIDTIGVKIGPFAMVDMYGTPHSPALRVVERYRLLDHEAAKEAEERVLAGGGGSGFAPDPDYKGKALRLEFTVEDEGVFTTPWSAAITYRRPHSPLGEWPESVCAENRHEYYAERTSRRRLRRSRISDRTLITTARCGRVESRRGGVSPLLCSSRRIPSRPVGKIACCTAPAALRNFGSSARAFTSAMGRTHGGPASAISPARGSAGACIVAAFP